MIHNKELEDVVRQLYTVCVEESKKEGVNFSSPEFLGNSYIFVPRGNSDLQNRIISAAFAPTFRPLAERAIQALYANSAGLTTEGYMCEAVNDFLNYAIPRAAGLQEEAKIFDEAYEKFDNSIYGESCLVTTFAILGNVWDNSGRVVLPDGFSLRYVSNPFGTPPDIRWVRERAAAYFEIQRSAHPIGRGREIKAEHAYFLFEHSQLLPQSKDLLFAAARLRDEITRKFVFAVRLLKMSAAFSDYRGCRIVGHLATHHMNLMNFPDDYAGQGPSFELSEYDGLRLRRLVPKLASMSYDEVSVMDTKLDDIIRRPRESLLEQQRTALKVAAEQLVDSFQILENIIPVAGSEYIALYSTVLLKAGGHTQFSETLKNPYSIFQFIKRMHTLRNDILHGRIDEVLNPKKPKIDPGEVQIFRVMVNQLGALYVLNGKLRDLASRLAVGEPTPFQSFHPMSAEEMNAMRKQKQTHPSW